MPQRPPFLGIHEILPDSGGNVPHEGGGDLAPYGEDIFQPIVDVNWGGGGGAVFTGGDTCCFIRSVRVPRRTFDQPWKFLGAPVFTTQGTATGGACAIIGGVPVFLLSGGNHDGGAVAYSNDGFNWEQTYGFDALQNHSLGLPYMYYLIWDPVARTFYGLSSSFAGNYDLNRATWVSKTGRDWAVLEVAIAPDNVFWQHTQNPYGEVDGIVGYNPKSNKWLHPYDVEPLVQDIPGMTDVFLSCVAYAGGIWQAYGMTRFIDGIIVESNYVGSVFFSSLDDGDTWEFVGFGDFADQNNDYRITAMLGLDIKFIPEEPVIPEPYMHWTWGG